MCGIVGIVGPGDRDPERTALVRRMAESLRHRGPDGITFASPPGCDLGLTRLAIVDLPHGAGPHSNEDGTVWSACNGEIYDAPERREDLTRRGHVLRSSVDTEVLPHLYEEHGADLARHVDGMFAFALWDAPRRRLVLGRDRAGEKPLHYAFVGESFVFASELRALLLHPALAPRVDPVALRRYLLHAHVPAPHSLVAGVRKLPAGHVAVLEGGELRLRRYWDLADALDQREALTLDAAAERVDDALSRAVARRRRADVDVGLFLSGGIDSSALLAHLTEQVGRGVPAFALGHADETFDESSLARRTAAAFGADLRVLVIDEGGLADGLRRVTEGFDEPLADGSIVPTHLLARFARESVKVVLSGEGGDELFGGYPTYLGAPLANALGRLPAGLRRGLLRIATGVVPPGMGNVDLGFLLGRFVSGADLPAPYRHHCWLAPFPPSRHAALLAPRVLASLEDDSPWASIDAARAGRAFPSELAELLYLDYRLYLGEGLLTKLDRATMLTSLEARTPFLDPELSELATRLPDRLKIRRLETKRVLRRSLERRLPAEVLTRKKRGFNIPFSRWLLGGLRPDVERRFASERVARRGLFDPAAVTGLLEAHFSRRADNGRSIFALLVLDHWLDRQFGDSSPVPLGEAAGTAVAVSGAAR